MLRPAAEGGGGEVMTEAQGAQLISLVQDMVTRQEALGYGVASCFASLGAIGLLLCAVLFFTIWRRGR